MDVISFGTPVMDLLINIDSQLPPNGSVYANDFSWQYGGKVSTGIVATKILCPDSECGITGHTGGAYGEYIRKDFVRHGIDISHLRQFDEQESPFAVCLSIKDVSARNFYIKPATIERPLPKDVEEEYVKDCTYLFIADARPGTQHACKVAKSGGAKVVYDADLYYDEGMPETIALTDYFIPSEMTYNHMYPNGGDYETNLREMKTMCSEGAVVIVTLGEKGVVGIDENDAFFQQDGYVVEDVDTTGAGDVYHGAFIAGLLRGMTVRESSQYAQATSAIKCTRIGGRAAIATHDVVMQFMQTGEIDYTEIDKRVQYYAKIPSLD